MDTTTQQGQLRGIHAAVARARKGSSAQDDTSAAASAALDPQANLQAHAANEQTADDPTGTPAVDSGIAQDADPIREPASPEADPAVARDTASKSTQSQSQPTSAEPAPSVKGRIHKLNQEKSERDKTIELLVQNNQMLSKRLEESLRRQDEERARIEAERAEAAKNAEKSERAKRAQQTRDEQISKLDQEYRAENGVEPDAWTKKQFALIVDQQLRIDAIEAARAEAIAQAQAKQEQAKQDSPNSQVKPVERAFTDALFALPNYVKLTQDQEAIANYLQEAGALDDWNEFVELGQTVAGKKDFAVKKLAQLLKGYEDHLKSAAPRPPLSGTRNSAAQVVPRGTQEKRYLTQEEIRRGVRSLQ